MTAISKKPILLSLASLIALAGVPAFAQDAPPPGPPSAMPGPADGPPPGFEPPGPPDDFMVAVPPPEALMIEAFEVAAMPPDGEDVAGFALGIEGPALDAFRMRGGPMMMGRGGMRGGCPMMGGGCFAGLDLTDEQLEKMHDLKNQFLDKVGPKMVELGSLKRHLMDVMAGTSSDAKKAHDLQNKINAAKADLANMKLDNDLAKLDVLTETQRKELHTRMLKGGMRGGMGKRMMKHHQGGDKKPG